MENHTAQGQASMKNWRWWILMALALTPLLVLLVAGGMWFWIKGWWAYAWWPLTGCYAIALLLAWRWQKKSRLLPAPDFTAELHWTDRDRQAWQLVTARAKAVKSLSAEHLLDVQFYVDTARDMADELAHFYHPRAIDPISALTITEILAVTELAAHDLANMVDDYLPGGHMLTIRHWRNAGKVADWYSTASKVYWVIAALFAPLNTAVRYAASRVGLGRPLQLLQENLVAWFYTAFVHRVGTYLIDLNSGRLRVGARRYRELLIQARQSKDTAAWTHDGPPVVQPSSPPSPAEVSITLLGQVKAGKSSLVNALLGAQRARTDVLPLTREITRYQLLTLPPLPAQGEGRGESRLVLLDTTGYGHAGPQADQLQATQEAVQQTDLALLVLNARDPARQPDLDMLQALRAWFQARPHLKAPRILGVLTHIDLLSPIREWSPPYHWLPPKQPKEQSIRDAVATVEEQLGQYLVGVVPVCVAKDKVYGVQEWLLPRLVEQLDEARAVALLRCLHAEADAARLRKTLGQLLQAAKHLVRAAVTWQKSP
ncbi:MAG TPA: GTPase [Candidatus Tectomicrobia bacterium]